VALFEPAPEPPAELPPARTVVVRGRGEFFLRDSGLFEESRPPTDPPNRPTVMLLHGWLASADLNWIGAYDDLIGAGYRVLAIDHRGHGRGLRMPGRFRLDDCADDVAGVLETMELAPALVVGYSMGGAIGQLLARDHPDVVAGLVLSGTAQHWQEPALRRRWKLVGPLGVGLSLAPGRLMDYEFKRLGMSETAENAWLRAELLRHNPFDVAEAGRELSRFDSRPWLRRLPMPTAVVATTQDVAVPPAKQYELAAALQAPVLEAPINHLEIGTERDVYDPVLLEALAAVTGAPVVR